MDITLQIPDNIQYTPSEILGKIKEYVKSLTYPAKEQVVSRRIVRHSYMTDKELDMVLSKEKAFDECHHQEMTDEQFRQLKRTRNTLTKGLEKWL